MREMSAREERAQIGVKTGECGATDGVSLCTEPAGHGPTHWDRHTRHEWHEDGPSAWYAHALEDWIARHPEADEKQIQEHEDAMITFHPMWNKDGS